MAGKIKSTTSHFDAILSLCSEEAFEFNGQKFCPDGTKAFLKFEICKAFPNYTIDGASAHPTVISKSYQSMALQQVDWEHMMAYYHTDKDIRDRVIGAVAAVSFPGGPNSKWTITPAERAPFITGIASIFKMTQGSATSFGAHKMGNRKLTVSMEALWQIEESGFAVKLPPGAAQRFPSTTPPDFISQGWEYVSYQDAPDRLRSTYSVHKKKIVSSYEGRKVVVLMGGLDNEIHFAGIGVCRFGAEPAARITGLLASQLTPLFALANAFKADMERLTRK